MAKQCKCCGRLKELRFGICFDCVESESILENGTDMYDNPPPKSEGMSMSMSKLKYILKKYISNVPNLNES